MTDTCPTCSRVRALLADLMEPPRRFVFPGHQTLYVDSFPQDSAQSEKKAAQSDADLVPARGGQETGVNSAVAAVVEGTRYPAGGLREPQGVGPQVSSGGGGANPPDGSYSIPILPIDPEEERVVDALVARHTPKPRVLTIVFPDGDVYRGDGT